MGKGSIFSPQHEAWRNHPMLQVKLRHMFPGFGYALAIFSTCASPLLKVCPHAKPSLCVELTGCPQITAGTALASGSIYGSRARAVAIIKRGGVFS